MNIKSILRKSVDLHVHVGPEIIPRKFTVEGLSKVENGKLKGVCAKSHFFPTVTSISNIRDKYKIKMIGSITLNNYVGGLNPDAVRIAAEQSDDVIMVWFPTINAENFLKKNKYEITPEWVNKRDFIPRLSSEVRGIKIRDNKRLKEMLKTIKEYGCILATGHISWKESELLIKRATEFGIEKIIVTHPIYQLIDMPIEKQKELADLGAFIEISVAMCTIDKILIEKIVEQIKYIGADRFILSSDVGQTFSGSPSEELEKFIRVLMKNSITEKEINQMLIKNPNKIIK